MLPIFGFLFSSVISIEIISEPQTRAGPLPSSHLSCFLHWSQRTGLAACSPLTLCGVTPSSSPLTVLYCSLPHCVQPLCPDIVSVNSMSVACCWVASPLQELEVGTRRAPYLLVIEHFISQVSYLFFIFGGPEKSRFSSSGYYVSLLS